MTNRPSAARSRSVASRACTHGTIAFVKSEGELVREGAIVGRDLFSGHIPPGNYKVELNAQKVVGKRKQKAFDGKDEEVELTEELFPSGTIARAS